jgi:hypothetical protein
MVVLLMWRDGGGEVSRMPAVELDMGLGQCGRRDARTVVERIEQVAVRPGIVRLEIESPSVVGDRLVEVPLVLERDAQVVLRLGRVWLELQRTLENAHRFVWIPCSLKALPRLARASAHWGLTARAREMYSTAI